MLIKVIAYLTLLLIYSEFTFAQTCNHTDLSLKYDYKVSVERKNEKNNKLRVSKLTVEIINKTSKKTEQTIVIDTEGLDDNVFTNCNNTRSYITGHNNNKEVLDDDPGDLVIADFNLDGKEDLALKSGKGGIAGPDYKFFTKRNDGTFQEDDFLPSVGNNSNAITSRIKLFHRSFIAYKEITKLLLNFLYQ